MSTKYSIKTWQCLAAFSIYRFLCYLIEHRPILMFFNENMLEIFLISSAGAVKFHIAQIALINFQFEGGRIIRFR